MANFFDTWRSGGTGIGAYTLKANSASAVPLILQGTTGQTANLFEIKNVAGTNVFYVDVSGNVTYLGDEYITDQLTVNGNATIAGTLGVTGATTLSTLTTSGLATFNSGINVTGDSYIEGATRIHSLRVEGDLSLQSGYIRSIYSANIHLLPAPSTITIIGDAGTTSHTLNTNDDCLITGRLEVDGVSYFDAAITVAGSATFTLGATDKVYIDGRTTRTGTTEVLDIDATIDTTTATDDVTCATIVATRGSGDTGGTRGWDVTITTGNMANGEWSYAYGGTYVSSACSSATSNAAVFYAGASTVDAQCNDYGLYISTGYDTAAYIAGNLTTVLAATEKVYIDGTSTAQTQTAGALDLNVTTATTSVSGADISITSTATGGQTNYAIKSAITSSAVVTGTSQSLYSGYFTATKTGADTNVNTTTLYALYGEASNTGSTNTGTKDTYGAYVKATGDANGTSTAIGIYAEASGADNNYAGVFSGNVVPLTDGGSALGTTTREWNGIYLYTGTAINWANSDVTITHASNQITIDGGTTIFSSGAVQMGTATVDCSTFTMIKGTVGSDPQTQLAIDGSGNFSITTTVGDITLTAADDFFVSVDGNLELALTGTVLYPYTSDGLALGDTTHMWADLFLNTAGVINFNNGELTITEAATGLTLAGTGMLNTTITQAAGTGAPVALTITGGAHTAITGATEDYGINFNFSANKTWAAGAGPLATQREILIQAPTYIGNAGGALTITKAATVAITGAPTQGANMTLSNTYALWVQAGRTQLDGGLSVAGGQFVSVTDVNAATYDLLTTDYILAVSYTATGAVTSLTLPTAQTVSGRMIQIKDTGGQAGINNITIDTEGSEKIDGEDTFVINANYMAITLFSNGSHWFVI